MSPQPAPEPKVPQGANAPNAGAPGAAAGAPASAEPGKARPQQAEPTQAERLQRAYQQYLNEVNRAWHPDDLPTQLQQEHRRFEETVRAAASEGGDATQRVLQAHQDLARGLRDALSPERLEGQFENAFRGYVRALREAWLQVKPEEANLESVATLHVATGAGLELAGCSAVALHQRAVAVAPLEHAAR
jgi:hypothetical protein